MNISVIGSGYVGLVVGTCLADLGNNIIGVDKIKKKVEKLNSGTVPIYEPGLQVTLQRNLKERRIRFTTDIKEAVENSKVIFLAVGTPPGKNHEADLSAVKAVARDIGKYMKDYIVVATKSTVPVGTALLIKKIIKENQTKPVEFDVVSNPEFLREGSALNDFMRHDRIIIGCESSKAKEIMYSIYKGMERTNKPLIFTDIKSAELIKYASNAMLATRISFMNELSHLCEKVGADVKKVATGMGLDPRIGPRFLQAGAGYGGSCFPKDVKALIQTMKSYKCEADVLEGVEKANYRQKKSITPKVKKLLPDIKGKKIAIWGLAFKPNTDDMREASSIVIINELQKLGAKIKAFDPEATENAKTVLKDIEYTENPYDTIKDADALVIVTEWNEFRNLEKKKIKSLMKHPNIVDGRNIYEPEEMKKLGFNYIGVGR